MPQDGIRKALQSRSWALLFLNVSTRGEERFWVGLVPSELNQWTGHAAIQISEEQLFPPLFVQEALDHKHIDFLSGRQAGLWHEQASQQKGEA